MFALLAFPLAGLTASGEVAAKTGSPASAAVQRLDNEVEGVPAQQLSLAGRRRLLAVVESAPRMLRAGRACAALAEVDSLRQTLVDPATWRGSHPPREASRLDRLVVGADRALLAARPEGSCAVQPKAVRVPQEHPQGPFLPVRASPAHHRQGGPEHPRAGANPGGRPPLKTHGPEDVTVPVQGGQASASRTAQDELPTAARTVSLDPFKTITSSDLGIPTIAGYPMEPQVASARGVVFYSGNNQATYSVDDGKTWAAWIHPDTMFGKVDGGYTGDSQVRYAPQIDSFIWLMQYACAGPSPDCSGTPHANRYRLAVATPAAIRANVAAPGKAWKVWSLQSVRTFKSTGWFDFPNIAVGDKKLYLTWDELRATGGDAALNARIDLKELKAGGTIGIQYWRYSKSIFWRVAQHSGPRGYFISNGVVEGSGATDLGRALSYTWDDASDLIVRHALDHDALPGGTYSYTDPLGETTWCRACDLRVESALVRSNELWVAWTAPGDATFPNPHIQIEIFDATTYALLRHDTVWSRKYAMALPALNVSSQGEVALAYTYGGPAQNPSPAVGFLTPKHDLHQVAAGEKVKGAGQGDYSCISPDFPDASRFVTSGYISRNETSGPTNHWRFLRFGRAPS